MAVYTDAIAEEICSRLSEGESLSKICRDDHMPNASSVRTWIRGKIDYIPEEFLANYARAREIGAEATFDEIKDLADDVALDSASIAKARLQTDNRKWNLARMNRAKYGDSTSMRLGGDADAPPIQTNSFVQTIDIATMTDEEVADAQKIAHAAMQRGAGK